LPALRNSFYIEEGISMKKFIYLTMFCLILASCAPNLPGPALSTATATPNTSPLQELTSTLPSQPAPTNTPLAIQRVTKVPTATQTPVPPVKATSSSKATAQASIKGKIPNFDHIVLIVLENQDYSKVIGSSTMPYFNSLAQKYVLLTDGYAVRHPSLPNYIALVSGDTQKITKDCIDCFVNANNLADLIEASGRTWKSYEESMPSPCFMGNADPYAQKHNPFIYFDSIRQNPTRCNNSIVPLIQLDTDLAANQLPNFSFIMPNLCNSGHDCSPGTADKWLQSMIMKLQGSTALGNNSLIIVTFDEGAESSTASCCGLGSKAGGKVATVLISPLAKQGFVDNTPTSHYGLLKTILMAWNLPDLGHTSAEETQPVVSPW
jgi:phosphatidylinositol-3-phosphatase